MSELYQVNVTIADRDDILRARIAARHACIPVAFDAIDETRLITAVSKLACNALTHAEGCVCTITSAVTDDGRRSVHVVVVNEGPKINDVTLPTQTGNETCASLGQGLDAVRRIVDNLVINSRPGSTVVEAIMTRVL